MKKKTFWCIPRKGTDIFLATWSQWASQGRKHLLSPCLASHIWPVLFYWQQSMWHLSACQVLFTWQTNSLQGVCNYSSPQETYTLSELGRCHLCKRYVLSLSVCLFGIHTSTGFPGPEQLKDIYRPGKCHIDIWGWRYFSYVHTYCGLDVSDCVWFV